MKLPIHSVNQNLIEASRLLLEEATLVGTSMKDGNSTTRYQFINGVVIFIESNLETGRYIRVVIEGEEFFPDPEFTDEQEVLWRAGVLVSGYFEHFVLSEGDDDV